jgi:hypothetical protein
MPFIGSVNQLRAIGYSRFQAWKIVPEANAETTPTAAIENSRLTEY